MQFEKYGKLVSNALDEIENEIQSICKYLESQLKRLSSLLMFIKQKKPSNYSKILLNFENKYNSLVNNRKLSSKLNISIILNQFENLVSYPKLVSDFLDFILQELDLSDDNSWVNKKIVVKHRNYLRGFLLPRYYNLEVLIESIGRDESIKLYKYFVSQYIKNNSSPTRKIFETVDEFREYFIMDKKKITLGTIGILSEIENGKFYFRKDNCLWADALLDLPDKEIKYLVCCYGDFQSAVSRSKGNFVLTMKQTIIEGDPFCDCIYHDTNINWDLAHPVREFWENIKPYQK